MPPRKQSPVAPEDAAAGMIALAHVVRAGSFRGAAQALGTTTSAISKRLAKLEDRLGVRLLERTTRRIALTEAGAQFHVRGLRVLGEIEEAEREADAQAGAPRGTLRVSMPTLLGETYIVPLLGAFACAHPQLRLDLSLSDRFVDLVEERFDCAVRVGRAVDSSLVARRVAKVPLLCVASPAYLRRAGSPESPEDLIRHVCLRYSLVPASAEWRFVFPDGERSVPVVSAHEANHGGAMRALALGGIGIARLPLFEVHEQLRSGALREVLAAFRVPSADLLVVHPARRLVPTKVSAFVKLLAAELPARLPKG